MAIDLKAILTFQDRATKPLMQVNRTIERVDRATNNYSRSMDKASNSGVSGFGRAATAVGGLVASIGGAIGVAKTLNATLGESARYQQSKVTIEAIFNDDKASKQYLKMVDKFAQNSPIVDTSAVMGSSKGLVGITKDLPTLQKALSVAEKMSVLDPTQGFEGASYALKELSSGDIVSMAERFEMPKKELNAIKNLSFDDQLAGIQKYLDKVGITDDTVKAMGTTTIGKFNQIKEKLATTFRTMGTSGNSQIGKALDGILAGFDSGAFDKVAKQIDAGLGTALSKLADYIKTIDFVALGNSASETFTKIADGVKWVNDNWKPIKETVIGLTAAIVTFKVGMAIAPIIVGVTEAIMTFKKATTLAAGAQAIFNGALSANPVGLVVAAIAGLIGIIVVLVRNWDTVTKYTKRFWRAIGGGSGVIRVIMGPLGILIGAAIDLAKNWDSTKSVWENVWGAMKRSAAATVNSVIGGINEMIKVINKIPGVNIPVVARVNWGTEDSPYSNTAANRTFGAQAVGYAGGLARVPYDGMPARLHEGERVLTKEQNDAYNAGMAGGNGVLITGNTFNVRQESDIEAIASALASKVYSAAGRGA